MWTWVPKEWAKDRSKDVEELKGAWMEGHGYSPSDVYADCFFCEYAKRAGNKSSPLTNPCSFCPGRRVDEDFYCMRYTYDYETKPVKFYAELKRLNKIRLAKKKK